jgi:LCP family protein required for cell wall assembly
MTVKKSLLLILVGSLLLAACNFPWFTPAVPSAVASLNRPGFVSAPANATPTSTPFQPLAITPTFLPTHQASESTAVQATVFPPTDLPPTSTPFPDTLFPGPSESPSIAIPPPVGRLPQPDGQVNILLLGSDQRPNDYGFRTDTILLLTLDPKNGRASLTSFPRDLYVYIPGWTMQRINTAQAHGGFETAALTFEYNFGVQPDHFVMINFWSFVEVIDSLNGVDVQVANGLGDQRDGYGYYYVPPGLNHMDGETALWYVRSRHTSSDFERTQRQQEVIQAVFERVLSLNGIKRAHDLYQIYTDNVTTDLKFDDIAPLLPLAAKLGGTTRIEHYFIGRPQVTGWVTPGGAQVLLPNRDAVIDVMRQALHSDD